MHPVVLGLLSKCTLRSCLTGVECIPNIGGNEFLPADTAIEMQFFYIRLDQECIASKRKAEMTDEMYPVVLELFVKMHFEIPWCSC